MARGRDIKPGFFLSDELAEVSRDARLLFAGLWTLADREGRLELRPMRIKAQVFPYDQDITPGHVEKMLGDLASARGRFIRIYEVDSLAYVQVENFKKHQHIHPNEKPSELPAPQVVPVITGVVRELQVSSGNYALPSEPSSLLNILPTDTPKTPKGGRVRSEYSSAFESAWKLYVRGEDKAGAFREWKRASAPFAGGESELLERITVALAWQIPAWKVTDREFPKHQVYFARYLSHKRWEDEKTQPNLFARSANSNPAIGHYPAPKRPQPVVAPVTPASARGWENPEKPSPELKTLIAGIAEKVAAP
jgi:hypothetical protein